MDTIIGQAITGVVTLGVAYIGYLKIKAGQKEVKQDVANVKQDVADVHTAVNSNLTVQQDRNEQLTAALTASNIAVPNSPEK
jgi:hypothetical protein